MRIDLLCSRMKKKTPLSKNHCLDADYAVPASESDFALDALGAACNGSHDGRAGGAALADLHAVG